jgi:hypothetical protein
MQDLRLELLNVTYLRGKFLIYVPVLDFFEFFFNLLCFTKLKRR